LFLPFKELQSLDLEDNGLVGCLENEGWFNVSALNYNHKINEGWLVFNSIILL